MDALIKMQSVYITIEIGEMNIGKSLKLALIEKDQTQTWLAAEMGRYPQQISKWANSGTMQVKNLEEICQHLGMKVSEFIKLGEDREE